MTGVGRWVVSRAGNFSTFLRALTDSSRRVPQVTMGWLRSVTVEGLESREKDACEQARVGRIHSVQGLGIGGQGIGFRGLTSWSSAAAAVKLLSSSESFSSLPGRDCTRRNS